MVTQIVKLDSAFFKHILMTILVFITLNANARDISTEIKSYISNIKSIAVEFTQTDSMNQEFKGMLIIDKPYKLRCNYYEPFPIVIVGNKNYISLYDYEMNNLSRVKAAENIFNFLLVDNIDFEKQFQIISAIEQGENYVISVKSNDLNKTSKITFDKKTKHIKQIQIFEEDNIITLEFDKTYEINNVANELFIMKDPDLFGKAARCNKTDLEKKFNIVR